jgi:hypothetical protein
MTKIRYLYNNKKFYNIDPSIEMLFNKMRASLKVSNNPGACATKIFTALINSVVH